MKDLITAMRVLAEEVEKQAIAMCINSYDSQLMALSYALCSASLRLEAELPKDEWIKNIGLNDTCPVESNTKIDVLIREGQTMYGLTAGNCRWINAGVWHDIIAYRVIPQ